MKKKTDCLVFYTKYIMQQTCISLVIKCIVLFNHFLIIIHLQVEVDGGVILPNSFLARLTGRLKTKYTFPKLAIRKTHGPVLFKCCKVVLNEMSNKLQLADGELVGAYTHRCDDEDEYENTAVHLDEDKQSDLKGKRLKLLYTQLSIVRRVYTGNVREENEELLYGFNPKRAWPENVRNLRAIYCSLVAVNSTMTEMFCIRVVQVIFAFTFYYYFCFISLSVNTHIVVKYLNRKLNHITCIYFRHVRFLFGRVRR